ncbi:MAG TPA: LLM class flavin-dependent oxidoreductase [Sphingomonadales bacterium]
MHLGLFFIGTGHHVSGWRHPATPVDGDVNIDYHIDVARKAEQAGFDFLFIADSSAMRGANDVEALSRTSRAIALEPLTTLGALAVATSRLGFIATITTSYNEPYNLARQLASLDHISKGRIGWNVVTSNNEAEALNFSRTSHYSHSDRYARAREFIEVARGLWDSFDDDAFVGDKEEGRFFRPDGLHRLDHKGEHFAVAGPLTLPRPPQGHPVIVQAGSSETGRDLAAQSADVVFTAQQTVEGARAFYADLKGRMAAYGRKPETLKIMPGFAPIVGRTQEEAEARFREVQSYVLPEVGLSTLQNTLGGADLSAYPLDGPVPELPVTNGPRSRQQLILENARRRGITLRELCLEVVVARGHFSIVGTPERIADEMQLWVETGAADGFNVMPQVMPTGLDDFIELVIPELRRRGLFRDGYAGTTLRDNLGLARPAPRRP